MTYGGHIFPGAGHLAKLALFDDYVRQSNALLAMARREGSGSMRICLNDVKEQDSWTPFQPPGIGSLLDLRQTRHVRRTKTRPVKFYKAGFFKSEKACASQSFTRMDWRKAE